MRRIISRQNLNEYLEILNLASMQFCDLPGFYRKKGYLRSQHMSLVKKVLLIKRQYDKDKSEHISTKKGYFN